MPLKLFIYNNNKAFECKGQEEAIEDYKLWGWCALENFGSFTFLVRLPVAVAKMGKCQNVRLGAWGWECLMFVRSFIFCRQRVSGNDLHACADCGTEATNCKPNTNLKEKIELSNLHQTSS